MDIFGLVILSTGYSQLPIFNFRDTNCRYAGEGSFRLAQYGGRQGGQRQVGGRKYPSYVVYGSLYILTPSLGSPRNSLDIGGPDAHCTRL